MSDRVFLDTNVLVYLFDDSEPVKQATAQQRLQEERRQHELVISTQVLQELYSALTRGAAPIRLPAEAESAVREASLLSIVQVDTPLILAAISMHQVSQISFWDALIIQAAAQTGCARVLSEDLKDGQRYGAVQVENPFAPQSRS